MHVADVIWPAATVVSAGLFALAWVVRRGIDSQEELEHHRMDIDADMRRVLLTRPVALGMGSVN